MLDGGEGWKPALSFRRATDFLQRVDGRRLKVERIKFVCGCTPLLGYVLARVWLPELQKPLQSTA